MSNERGKYKFELDIEGNKELLQTKDKCDKYDYIVSVACGAIGGMIDIFLVGAPGDSACCNWTDKQVDEVVMSFARKTGWNPKEKNANNVNSAIGFLERNYKVNYDQRKPGDVNNYFNIAPNTHHMMSLAHSPDIVGLFFSIVNQFTDTSSFIANGQLITINSETGILLGGNFVMKIMCGITNWFGHLMSDMAGSSGSHNRGTGIVMPFYELFGFCKLGKFSTQNGVKDLSEIALQAFTQGYDLRFGLAQAIPVVITELSIRLIWSIRHHFQYGKPLKECIPSMAHDDLRVMLLLGNGTLCVLDGMDAVIKSGGNFLAFFMRLNLIAWFRFVMLVLKEVCIRLKISTRMQACIEAYKRINEALLDYLHELEKIDIEAFRSETEECNNWANMIEKATDAELNTVLLEIFDKMGYEKPWQGDFDTHMSDKNATLVFE